MTDTYTREERRDALDEFASMAEPVNEAQLPVVAAPPSAMPAVYGAQQLAIKRDTRRVLREIKELASAAGEDWYYRFPVKNKRKGTTDYVEGPTIKLANDVARIYGNCEVDCRATDLGTVVLYHARFIDLETGFALTRPFQQRKGVAKMGDDAGRNEDAGFQIGASKAIRNVVVNALQTYADFAFIEAKSALVDRIGSNLAGWRQRAVDRISALASLDRVEAVVGRPAKDWLAPDVARVIAMGRAISEGMASVDETFPPLGQASDAGKAMDTFAGTPAPSGGPAAAAPPAPPAGAAAATIGEDEIVPRLLRLAGEPGDVEDRLAALDISTTMLQDLFPAKVVFIKAAVAVVAELIKGEKTIGEAATELKEEYEASKSGSAKPKA